MANLDKGGAEAGQNAGAAIQNILTSKDLSDVLDTSTATSAAAAKKAVDDGKAAVAVIVPEDFSAVVYGSDPTAKSQVELYENPTAEIGGSIVEGVVGQVLADFNGARAAAAGAVALRSDSAGDPPAAQVAATAAELFSHDGGVSAGLQISQRSPQAGKTEKDVSVTGQILAGMMIFFMFFGAANVARTILTEDRDGTMPRLFTTPTRHGTIIAGKFVSVFVTILVQAIVLLVAGRIIFGIQWGRLDAVVLLTVVRRRRGRRPRAARHLVRQDAGAGRRHRLRHLPRAGAARRQLHRHRADRAGPTPRCRSSRPTAGSSTAGTWPCAAAAPATSAGRSWCRSGSPSPSSSSPCSG